MPDRWSGFSFIVTNLARFIRPDEITFSGVNSTPPMLACLLAKRAYDFDFTYINVAGGVQPTPSKIPLSSSDPVLSEGSTAIFANEDFYDLCTRGRMDLPLAPQPGRCGNHRAAPLATAPTREKVASAALRCRRVAAGFVAEVACQLLVDAPRQRGGKRLGQVALVVGMPEAEKSLFSSLVFGEDFIFDAAPQ